MDNYKIGSFIADLRREKGMTQKELAEKLNVTDKAVSKWERGVGYPEITMIPILSDALGITTGELLLGEHIPADGKQENQQADSAKTELIVSDAMEYVSQAHEYKTSKGNRIVLAGLTIAFLLAIFVCMLCNYVISGAFDWSLYVVGGEVVAWLLVFPFLAMKRHRCVAALTGLTVTILPLLLLIEHLCPAKNWVFPFALSVAGIALISLWVSVLLFVYTRISRWFLASFVWILFGVIAQIGINAIVGSYFPVPDGNISVLIVAFSSAFIAVVLAMIGNLKKKELKNQSDF